MTAKEIVGGVGTRYGVLIPLDSDGLPSIQSSTAVPQQGTMIAGIKTAITSDPEPQRITHFGQDRPQAQDSLPPTTVGNFTITADSVNLIIDAMAEGNTVRSINTGKWRAGNSDQRGNEPIIAAMFYRQALDMQPGSGTYGKLRQWNTRIYPAARVSPTTQPYDAGATDKSYAGTPTPTGLTLWGETYTESQWGNNYAEYTEGVVDYEPRINWYLGNGTLLAFQLSHPPAIAGTTGALDVWVAGTLTTPSAVNISLTNPAFTLAAPPAVGAKVVAMVYTTQPGIN
jgi:hypothetical protein